MLLVACKADAVAPRREVPTQEGAAFALAHGLPFLEVSAKHALGFADLDAWIVQAADKRDEQEPAHLGSRARVVHRPERSIPCCLGITPRRTAQGAGGVLTVDGNEYYQSSE